MRYLVAEAHDGADLFHEALIIIPVTEQLTCLLHTLSSLINPSIESLRPIPGEEYFGYLIEGSSQTSSSRRTDFFRRMLLNELDGHEFLFMEECDLMNEEILSELAGRHELLIDVQQYSAMFRIVSEHSIHFTTYSIPLTFMPLQIKSLCGNIYEQE